MTTTGAGVTAPRVVVAGGHSAGHIEPAMNFADALRWLEPTAEITALGTVRGLDTALIQARGYPLELIPPVPLPRKLNRAWPYVVIPYVEKMQYAYAAHLTRTSSWPGTCSPRSPSDAGSPHAA